MKTTTMFRNIANPRRTTLAHLDEEAGERLTAQQQEHAVDLPNRTANPRRTILLTVPGRSSALPGETDGNTEQVLAAG